MTAVSSLGEVFAVVDETLMPGKGQHVAGKEKSGGGRESHFRGGS